MFPTKCANKKKKVNENSRDKMVKSTLGDIKDAKRRVEMKSKMISSETSFTRVPCGENKLLRRHSYEIAILAYSWLPDGQPSLMHHPLKTSINSVANRYSKCFLSDVRKKRII